MFDVVYIFKGVLIGLMVSVPLGPMGVLIIQKTLQKGALAGFVAGMGAAFADLFYATVAAFGLGFVINIIQTHELVLQIIGGIFLLIVGLKIYFDNPLKQIRMKKRVSKTGLLGDFLTLFFRIRGRTFFPDRIVCVDGRVAGRRLVVVHAVHIGQSFPQEIPVAGADYH